MSQDNHITLRGYVTAEPRFWEETPTLSPHAEIRVGSTVRRLNRDTGEWLDGDTSYYTVKCWRRLAVNVASSLRKGDMVLIRGKVVMRTWLDDQQRSRTQMQVEADSVGHDLSYGWSRFIRGVQAPPPASRDLADGEMSRQGVSDDTAAGAGGPGRGEAAGAYDGGEYNGYLAAGPPADDERDDQEESAGNDGAIDELMRDLGAATVVAPVF